MRASAIVVATDGATSGDSTVRWAAVEAGRPHMNLRVVHVLDWGGNTARYEFGGNALEVARDIAESVTARAAATARAIAPEIDVTEVTLIGDPAARLLDAAEAAESLVIGSRGHGVIVGTLLGSTGLQLLHHADCPVYVDRPRREHR
jgi:nucleotide-binding universal stress UspA family protein